MTRAVKVRARAGARAAVAAALVALGWACAAPEGRSPLRVGEPIRPYEATTLAGDTVSLESFRGKVVLLNLWATWCAPCRAETPYLQALYEERRDQGFEILGASMDQGNARRAVESFVEEYGVTYTILHDPTMRAMDQYQVLGLPATFLVDREGTLRWFRFGPIDEGDATFLAALDAVLAQ